MGCQVRGEKFPLNADRAMETGGLEWGAVGGM